MHGSVVITHSVQSLGEPAVTQISTDIASFDAFTADNDPYGEHDFGSITFRGDKLFWKVDCFDRRMKCHSPDAANPERTHRVLTIMLAGEY